MSGPSAQLCLRCNAIQQSTTPNVAAIELLSLPANAANLAYLLASPYLCELTQEDYDERNDHNLRRRSESAQAR
jgi:hypothetical protein